jgi:PAS domain S-box-containing protein
MSPERAEPQRIRASRHENGELFRAIYSQAAIGIAQLGLDGKWQLLNDRLCGILDCTQAGLQGRTALEVTHPDDREAVLEGQCQLLAAAAPSYSKVQRFIRQDGTTVWTNWSLSLVRDPDGAPQYFVAVVEDITEKRHAEQALRESEQRFGSFMQHMPGAAFMKDLLGRYVYVRPPRKGTCPYPYTARPMKKCLRREPRRNSKIPINSC